MTLVIRNVQKEDRQYINELVEAINKADNLCYSLTDEWFDYIIKAAGEGIFAAIYDNKLTGLATCMINQTDKSQAAVNVVIHPGYRSRGIGSELYNQIISYSRAKDIRIFEACIKKRLEVSVRFAEKRGFYPVLFSWQMDMELDKTKFDMTAQKGTGLIFKEAAVEDGDAYAEIINRTFGDELDNSALEQLLKDSSVRVYMLEKEGKTIGSVTVQFRTNLSVGYIYDVAVAEKYRGQGFGSFLLKSCINELKDKKMGKASLLVTGENKSALDLYYRLGFRETDVDIIVQKTI